MRWCLIYFNKCATCLLLPIGYPCNKRIPTSSAVFLPYIPCLVVWGVAKHLGLLTLLSLIWGLRGDEENICNIMVGPTHKWCKPILWEYILTLQGDLVSLGKSSQQVRENCDKSARELLNLKMASERKNKNFCPFMASCFPIWTAPSLNCSTRG